MTKHGGRPVTRGGHERDVIAHRRELCWTPGTVRDVKRRMNRRARRQWRQQLAD